MFDTAYQMLAQDYHMNDVAWTLAGEYQRGYSDCYEVVFQAREQLLQELEQ